MSLTSLERPSSLKSEWPKLLYLRKISNVVGKSIQYTLVVGAILLLVFALLFFSRKTDYSWWTEQPAFAGPAL